MALACGAIDQRCRKARQYVHFLTLASRASISTIRGMTVKWWGGHVVCSTAIASYRCTTEIRLSLAADIGLFNFQAPYPTLTSASWMSAIWRRFQ
jgi:hypothetical protein